MFVKGATANNPVHGGYFVTLKHVIIMHASGLPCKEWHDLHMLIIIANLDSFTTLHQSAEHHNFLFQN